MIPKRVFQVVALATLPLPFAATWAAWPSRPRRAEGSDVAFVLAWAVVLWFPVAAAVSAVLAMYHLARGLLSRAPASYGSRR